MQFSINTEKSTQIFHESIISPRKRVRSVKDVGSLQKKNWYEISYLISNGADTKKPIIIPGWKVRMSVVMTAAKKRVHKIDKKMSTISDGFLVKISNVENKYLGRVLIQRLAMALLRKTMVSFDFVLTTLVD